MVSAHAANTGDPGSNLARGPVLHVSLPFLIHPLSNKGVYASENLKKNNKKNKKKGTGDTACQINGME